MYKDRNILSSIGLIWNVDVSSSGGKTIEVKWAQQRTSSGWKAGTHEIVKKAAQNQALHQL